MHVQLQASELLQHRELIYILLGNKGRQHLELRQKTNDELFTLYEGELAFHHYFARAIHEAKRMLIHFHNYLGEFLPTPELDKSFLSQFKNRKSTTSARCAAIHTGLRHSELARLKVGDIDLERQVLVVRQCKGSKDRVIPLPKNTCEKLAEYIKGKKKEKGLFGLAPASISGKIRIITAKARVKLHTHSLRDYFVISLPEKGVTIREIQLLLGHTNLTHTKKYSKSNHVK